MCLRAVRVGGALLATVDGTAAIGLSGAAVESSGATSLRLADVQLQSTGSLDSSFGADVYVGMQEAHLHAAKDAESVVGGSAATRVGADGLLQIGNSATATVGSSAALSAQTLRLESEDSINAIAGHDLSVSAQDDITISTAGSVVSLSHAGLCANRLFHFLCAKRRPDSGAPLQARLRFRGLDRPKGPEVQCLRRANEDVSSNPQFCAADCRRPWEWGFGHRSTRGSARRKPGRHRPFQSADQQVDQCVESGAQWNSGHICRFHHRVPNAGRRWNQTAHRPSRRHNSVAILGGRGLLFWDAFGWSSYVAVRIGDHCLCRRHFDSRKF